MAKDASRLPFDYPGKTTETLMSGIALTHCLNRAKALDERIIHSNILQLNFRNVDISYLATMAAIFL